ncbi:MAG: FAD binding domain-containing protein [Lachnospiraceae bacterium]
MVTGYYPKTQKDALQQLQMHPGAKLINGGTDANVTRKYAEHIIFLNQVQEFLQISVSDGVLRIGASATYRMLLASDCVPNLLKESMQQVASPAIKTTGTLVGNICNASPAGDTLPVLYALNAVIVKSRMDEGGLLVHQHQPIEEFITGVRKLDLSETEMVTFVEIPVDSLERYTLKRFEKVGARQAEAIAKLSFCGILWAENGRIKDVRLTFGSVGTTVVRDRILEQSMIDMSLTDLNEKKEYYMQNYGKRIWPINDQRSTANYRKKVCLNLLNAFLEEAACF